jgi:hypothetical protein
LILQNCKGKEERVCGLLSLDFILLKEIQIPGFPAFLNRIALRQKKDAI